MSRYTHESPMDFKFDNGTGPVDARSPLAQVGANAQRLPGGMNSSPRKRTNGAFNSPSKSRTMGNQQSSPTKPLPSLPAYNSIFTTPRKSKPEIDDSSAGETPNSPAPRDDSDATPEIRNTRTALMRLDSASAPTLPGAERERASPTKYRPESHRRESFISTHFTKLKNSFRSPGRGEIPRSEYTGAVEKRVATRRKRDADRRVARRRRHSMSDSGEDHDQLPSSLRKTSGQLPNSEEDKPHWAKSFFTFIAQHPSLPETLTVYAQFIFNIFLLLCCGYLIYCFWSAVKGDVDTKSEQAMAGIMVESKKCLQEYESNNCASETRPPYMQNVCENWLNCIKRDPRKVGRARVSAHTFAEIYTSFVEPISYKAMLFTFVLVLGSFGVSNIVFSFFRSKVQQHPPNYGYGYGYGGPPPPTPQRSFSGQDGAFYAGTPWHQPPPGLGFEPQPSGGYPQIQGQGSPVRQLSFH